MLTMVTNNTGIQVGYLAGKYPGLIGHLYSPGGQSGPYPFIQYALDNGAFSAYKNNTAFTSEKWAILLEWANKSGQQPLWSLVPDCVADKERTLRMWDIYYPLVKSYNFTPAFAVQDGMSISDVPVDAEVVFVGGTTEWKWANAWKFCEKFERVHIGRVNTIKLLRMARDYGAESTDGTGWVRGDQTQWRGLIEFLEEESGNKPRQEAFPLINGVIKEIYESKT